MKTRFPVLFLPVLMLLLVMLLSGCSQKSSIFSEELDEDGFPVNFDEAYTEKLCMPDCDTKGMSSLTAQECDEFCNCVAGNVRDTMTYEDFREILKDDKLWNEEQKDLMDYCLEDDQVLCKNNGISLDCTQEDE